MGPSDFTFFMTLFVGAAHTHAMGYCDGQRTRCNSWFSPSTMRSWRSDSDHQAISECLYSLSHLAVLSVYVGTVSVQMSGISRDPRTVPCVHWRPAAYRLSPHDFVGTLVTFPGSPEL